MNGRRGRTRTCDPLLRRQMLYPPELRARLPNTGIGTDYLLTVALSTSVPRGTLGQYRIGVTALPKQPGMIQQ
jgi:hypothetical protein